MIYTVSGPLWNAEIDVVTLSPAQAPSALRHLYRTRLATRDHAGAPSLSTPGAMLLLGRARAVNIQPGATARTVYRWTRASGDARDTDGSPELALLNAELAAGELVLLVVTQNDSAGDYTCLNGDISLQPLVPERAPNTTDQDRLYKALRLAPPTAEVPTRFRGALSVHGSGVSLNGRRALPWQTGNEMIAGSFQLGRSGTSDISVTLERERLTTEERGVIQAAWRDFARMLNPRAADAAPHWINLEIGDADLIPPLSWHQESLATEPVLRFGSAQQSVFSAVLTDRSPYNRLDPPQFLGRIFVDQVTVIAAGDALRVEVAAGDEAQRPAHGKLHLSATRNPTGQWHETLSVDAPSDRRGMALAFDPLQTPRLLRELQSLPTPEWFPVAAQDRSLRSQPIATPLVFGFMPLNDGWAQLPVANLTEQIYLDARMDTDREDTASDAPQSAGLLEGVVSWGNDEAAVLQNHPDEQAWRLTLTQVSRLFGRWTFKDRRLNQVEVTLDSPGLMLEGLLWLATTPPSTSDALPALDDWQGALRSVTLRTLHDRTVLFPPPIRVDLEQLAFSRRSASSEPTSAELTDWSWLWSPDAALLASFADRDVLPKDVVADNPPWVWRRHPSLPMVQALPLTQNQSPPNYPGASRQLMPFALPPGTPWRFSSGGRRGARTWPIAAVEGLIPAMTEVDLPLVSLSVPGLILDPARDPWPDAFVTDPAFPMTLQYRFDLPVTDQLQALADVPKDTPKAADAPSSTTAETPALALTRGVIGAVTGTQQIATTNFSHHWQRLSVRASLAAADAVDAITQAGETMVLQSLIEPFVLPLSANASFTTRRDAAGHLGRLTLRDDLPALAAATALEGISATFDVDATTGQLQPADSGNWRVLAGSMAAQPVRKDTGKRALRDQRGLERGASQVGVKVVRTAVTLDAFPAVDRANWELVSTLLAQPLIVPGAIAWQIWVRDLPLLRDTFIRGDVVSADNQDINDPESLSRNHDFLNGYEWRLGDGTPASGPLQLLGLNFFPLTLEHATFDEDTLTQVQIVGRLQLPIGPTDKEFTDGSDAVRLSFARDAGGELTLNDIEAASGPLTVTADRSDMLGAWALGREGVEASSAPRLVWRSLTYDTQSSSLEVQTTLHFFQFGVAWRVPLAPLVFANASEVAVLQSEGTVEAGSDKAPLRADSVEVHLNDQTTRGLHRAHLFLQLALVDEEGDSILSAMIDYDLVGAKPPALKAGTDVNLLNRLKIKTVGGLEKQTDALALQITWDSAGADSTNQNATLLPGIGLDPDRCRGFAALAFTATLPPHSGAVAVPHLALSAGFVEAVLGANQGRSNFDDPSALTSAGDDTAIRLSIGYTARWVEQKFEPGWTLSGLLEISNLISWPRALTDESTAPPDTLTVPATDDFLPYRRHVIRVLFNQHRLHTPLLHEGQASAEWSPLTVVEHLLQTVDEQGARSAQRFTALQRVRFMTPVALTRTLEAASPESTTPHGFGVDDARIRKLLLAALAALANNDERTRTLLIDASAPLWIRRTPLTGAAMTTLSPLPGGNVKGALSGPQEYTAHDARNPDWLLVTLPFLGRLQDAADGLDANPLRTDPVALLADGAFEDPQSHALARALAGRGAPNAEAMTLTVSALDGADGRRFARLDPDALERSWLALQHQSKSPAAQTDGSADTGRLHSVLTTSADTAARLSRETTLQRAAPGTTSAYPGTPVAFPAFEAVIQGAGQSTNSLTNPTFEGLTETLRFHRNKLDSDALPHWRIVFAPGKSHPSGKSRSPSVNVEVVRSNGFNSLKFRSNRSTYPAASISLIQSTVLSTGDYTVVFSLSLDNRNHAENFKNASVWLRVGDNLRHFWFDTIRDGSEQTATVQQKFTGVQAGTVDISIRIQFPIHPTQWRISDIALLSNAAPAPAGWHVTAAALRALDLPSAPGSSTVHHHVAATLLPIEHGPGTAVASAGSAMRIVTSPYLSLGFETLQAGVPLIVSAELLTLDATGGRLRSTATRFWELDSGRAEAEIIELAQTWGQQTQMRLSPSSATSVLRLRTISRAQTTASTTAPGVTLSYKFLALASARQLALAQRVFPLRAPVAALRFRDGRFGGHRIPTPTTTSNAAAPFEVAPPLVNGLEPVRLTMRPGSERFLAWPWGWSGLRVSVRYAAHDVAIVGAAADGDGTDTTVWWQAPRHRVQFRSALTTVQPTAGLPNQFRARAIRSFLPAPPAPPLPVLRRRGDTTQSSDITGWQSVLPGSVRYLLTGQRPGTMLALRHHLIGQRIAASSIPGTAFLHMGETLVSGSVPVQHRVPRPVDLPANVPLGAADVAALEPATRSLQPFASASTPERNVRVTPGPADEAYFASRETQPDASPGPHQRPARHAALELIAPAGGEFLALRANRQKDAFFRTGAVTFELRQSGLLANAAADAPDRGSAQTHPLSPWLDVSLETGTEALPAALTSVVQFQDVRAPGKTVWQVTCQVAPDASDSPPESDAQREQDRWQRLLQNLPAGQTIVIKVGVGHDEHTAGYRQDLRFPLRVVDTSRPRLPLRPHFLQFEDPQYNRRLSSAPLQLVAPVVIKINDKDQQSRQVVLATDRREYEPAGRVAFRYDWEGDEDARANLDFVRVDASGQPHKLAMPGDATPLHNLAGGQLIQFALGDLIMASSKAAASFVPGDVLELTLSLVGVTVSSEGANAGNPIELTPTALTLRVNIVGTVQTPTPEAAYALLKERRDVANPGVECARFAWSPIATRIDLVDPDDLRRGVVRRRAVFQWMDTRRPGERGGYAIQKITAGGATHFPDRFDDGELDTDD